MQILILAAGKGSKFFPYDAVGSKTLRKVAGIPIIEWNIRALRRITDAPIRVLTMAEDAPDFRRVLFSYEMLDVIPAAGRGTAETLLSGVSPLNDERFIVLYGDTIVSVGDLEALLAYGGTAALLSPLADSGRNVIACDVHDGYVGRIGAHDRGAVMTHAFAGFSLSEDFIPYLERTPQYFPDVKVGVSVPAEPYLEAALAEYLRDHTVPALICKESFYDIDKPWHLLSANAELVASRCSDVTETALGAGSEVSPEADIRGFVRLGKRSYIGKRVLVRGNLIVGDDTVIDNGAIFLGNCVVGSRCRIANYCQVYDGCSIGDDCIVDHAAEFLGGMLMDKVYLYHYGEFFGAIGSYTDIGAGTVCGTLRFDDGFAKQCVNGRREPVENPFFNAVYLGDYVRTGVHAAIMPGCKVGAHSVIGSGVVLEEDVPPRTIIRLKQELIRGTWGPQRYGW